MRALILALVLVVAGCGAGLLPILTQVVAIAGEAAIVIDRIADFVAERFAAEPPDYETRKRVEWRLERARTEAATLHRAGRGGRGMTRAELDERLLRFRLAYEDLLEATKPLGVAADVSGTLSAAPGRLGVPRPKDLVSLEDG